jgi:3-deoxy-D-manno-octulosonate 8-phosphate phosphatase (KDO 8-P phosphatase)
MDGMVGAAPNTDDGPQTTDHGAKAVVRGSSSPDDVKARARAIRLVLTDSDGVLTDNGVYYSARGEEMKRFSIRDGMGVERLRVLAGVDVGIITGELSGAVEQRAAKLQISELHLGIKDKAAVLGEILARTGLDAREVAFIGDDTNDLEIMSRVGLAGCPADATPFARAAAHYICPSHGGYGAFRDFAELIIAAKG